MAINFHPKRGTVLVCDFDGFKKPEMVKRRPVVVVSPRYRRRTGLCLVVPLSTRLPHVVEPHHYEIAGGKYDFFSQEKSTWAKADMLTCVSFERLDRVLLHGRYRSPQLMPEDLRAVLRCIAHALQLHVDCAEAIA